MTDEKDPPRIVLVGGGGLVPQLLKELDRLGLGDVVLVSPFFRLRAYHLERIDPGMIIEPKVAPNDLRPTLLEMCAEDIHHRHKVPKVRDRRKDIKKHRRRRR